MPLLIQICIVVATIGLVAVEIMVIRAMRQVRQIGRDASRVTDAVEHAAHRFDRLADATSELLESARDVVAPLRKASGALSVVGQRAATISGTVMDELEPPVHLASAFSRGIRTGVLHLVGRLGSRWRTGRATTNAPNGAAPSSLRRPAEGLR